eukprot:555068-Rhodomonas_salina.1
MSANCSDPVRCTTAVVDLKWSPGTKYRNRRGYLYWRKLQLESHNQEILVPQFPLIPFDRTEGFYTSVAGVGVLRICVS